MEAAAMIVMSQRVVEAIDAPRSSPVIRGRIQEGESRRDDVSYPEIMI
jgi:hypothetical protein